MPDGVSRDSLPRLLVTTDAVGGVWRYSLDLADGFASRGVRTLLAVLGPAPSEAQREEALQAGVAVLETGLPLDWTARTGTELTDASVQLRALAVRWGASAVHLHAPALAGPEEWPIPLVVVAHSCVATWWQAVRGGALPEDFRWRAEATAAGLRVAAAVIAPTRAHADAVRRVYGPMPIQVVHNGAKRPSSDRQPSRERAVLTAGRLWDEGKNAAALDRVAAALGTPIRGAGPFVGPNGAVISLGNLQLLGNLSPEEMARAYAGASVFASLARYEPFGLSVLEAALSGMRLVLSDIPSFRELWDGAATFVPDERDLPGALRRALDEPGDGGAQARAGRYTLDATVEGTLAVHRGIGVPV